MLTHTPDCSPQRLPGFHSVSVILFAFEVNVVAESDLAAFICQTVALSTLLRREGGRLKIEALTEACTPPQQKQKKVQGQASEAHKKRENKK